MTKIVEQMLAFLTYFTIKYGVSQSHRTRHFGHCEFTWCSSDDRPSIARMLAGSLIHHWSIAQ